MKTRIRIIRPDQADEPQEHDLPREPGYEKLAALIEPILGKGHWLERVAVLADFDGGENHQPTDMFVDENGHQLQLPFNREATRIYRRAYLQRFPDKDPAEPQRDSYCAWLLKLAGKRRGSVPDHLRKSADELSGRFI